ncbi:methyl-accepting chemotaxis protein [Brevibacillus sp. SYSU BS000544]|uniref:methyl-accepting chemotaxis protein n=1 Tax=Brevibacillus sp. SYSU BS000544 TaxID=3416443 RepID=UPI003CE57335
MKIGTRLLLILLLVGTLPLTAAGFFAYTQSKQELLKSSEQTLEALRNSRKEQVENYFSERSKNLDSIAGSSSVIQLFFAFEQVWRKGKNDPAYQELEVKAGKEIKMMQTRYGFSNFYVVNEFGDIIFQAKPQNDFGTNLLTGKYKDTPFGQIVAKVSKSQSTEITDVARYEPSGNNPVIFMSSPIFEQGRIIGQLVAEVSLDYVSRLLDRREGLGQTGKVYLIGQDKLLRSELYVNDGTTSLLTQKIDTPLADQALQPSEEGATLQSQDFRGVDTLVSYSPIKVGNLKWAIFAEMDIAEIMAAPNKIRNTALLFNAIVFVIVAIVASMTARGLRKPMQRMVQVTEQIGAGDLTVQLEQNYLTRKDEIGDMARAFGQMQGSLTEILGQVKEAAVSLNKSTQEINGNATDVSASTEHIAHIVVEVVGAADHQVNRMEHTLTLAERLSNGIQVVASNAEQVAHSATEMQKNALQGRKAMEGIIMQMQEIHGSVKDSADVISKLDGLSHQISHMIQAITQIANQTNLLALNAAIEAARAGEHGKGFAVVAGEVRKLSEGTNEAAQNIIQIVSEIQKGTEQAVQQMQTGSQQVEYGLQTARQSGDMFHQIERTIDQVTRDIEGVSSEVGKMNPSALEVVRFAEEVSASSAQASSGMQSISAAIEEQSASMNMIATSTDQLAELAHDLEESLQRFSIAQPATKEETPEDLPEEMSAEAEV